MKEINSLTDFVSDLESKQYIIRINTEGKPVSMPTPTGYAERFFRWLLGKPKSEELETVVASLSDSFKNASFEEKHVIDGPMYNLVALKDRFSKKHPKVAVSIQNMIDSFQQEMTTRVKEAQATIKREALEEARAEKEQEVVDGQKEVKSSTILCKGGLELKVNHGLLAKKWGCLAGESTKEGKVDLTDFSYEAVSALVDLSYGLVRDIRESDTPEILALAKHVGDTAAVQEIVQQELNSLREGGTNPLRVALDRGNFYLFPYLSQNCATQAQKDDALLYAFHLLGKHPESQSDLEECIEYLIVSGANPNQKVNNGRTPLLFVATAYPSLANKLIKNPDVDINITNMYGETLLHRTVEAGRSDWVKLLFTRQDLQLEAKSVWDKTAHELAIQKRDNKGSTKEYVTMGGIAVAIEQEKSRRLSL